MDQFTIRLSWVKMDFQKDFFDVLKNLGRLPNINANLEVVNKKLREEKNKIQEELKAERS